MQHSRRDILRILKRYRAGKANADEIAFIETYYDFFNKKPQEFREKAEVQKEIAAFLEQHINREPKVIRLWPRIAVAASILLCIGTGGYFLLKTKLPKQQIAQHQTHDVAPGHNQATLTLANGKKIILTKGLNGLLATQGKTTIIASQNTIAYNGIQSANESVNYNTLSTAKGEQSPYPLVLADGTKVWLNSESSITFPTVFNQKERLVKLTGEAYFEVKHNDKQGFKVIAPTQTIEDIGTQFNVKAYADEPAPATTLVEGSVKVNNVILKPGEEKIGDRVETANLKEVLAWKDGYFRFSNASITTIMRELARWYDIEVVYEGPVTQEHFSAKISRYKNISNVLQMLEKTKHVHFKIEGRRVTVLSKS